MKIKTLLFFFALLILISVQAQSDSLLPAKELSIRGGLRNFYTRMAIEKKVRVAFLGGSITRAGNGYRDQILKWLRERYPTVQFEEIMAAVSGTGSDFGASRVQQHVIDHKPDLVFVEFAVNDNGWRMQFVRETMEGIVRQIWHANRKTDICFVYTFANTNLPQLQKGLFPASVTAMESVADHYQIPSIHMGLAVIDQLNKGNMIMMGKKDSTAGIPLFSVDGVHPLPETGHKIYTEVLAKNLPLLNIPPHVMKHVLPTPLETNNWSEAGMARLLPEKNFTGDWQTTDSVTKGKEYYPLLPQVFSTASTDAVVTVKFKGTRFGLADIMGPSTAVIEISIDNDPPRIINRFDAYCTYYRLNYFIIQGLSKGKHMATIRLSDAAIDKEAILKTRNTIMKDPAVYRGRNIYVGAILY